MRKLLVTATAIAALAVPATATAGKPADPGCFGTDRADIINSVFKNGGALDTGPGASEWGAIAGDRAGTNGGLNRAYKTSCGGDPTT
jgi:hypothetical protein